MMILFRFLVFFLLINTLSTYDPWILPRSTSFHHALELFHARVKISNLSSSRLPLTLPALLPFTRNETTCYKDLSLLMNGFQNQEKWALKIIDSWGIKPPAGILEGSHLWLGSYDECIHSLYLPVNRSYLIQPYKTQYCTVSSPTNDDDSILFQKPTLIVGICLPKSCDSNNFQMKFVKNTLTHFSIYIFLVLCLFNVNRKKDIFPSDQ